MTVQSFTTLYRDIEVKVREHMRFTSKGDHRLETGDSSTKRHKNKLSQSWMTETEKTIGQIYHPEETPVGAVMKTPTSYKSSHVAQGRMRNRAAGRAESEIKERIIIHSNPDDPPNWMTLKPG